MNIREISERDREVANHLLEAAWLTDRGRLFVKREDIAVPGFDSAEAVFDYAQERGMFTREASFYDDKVALKKGVVEYFAGHRFALKDPDRVEFLRPEGPTALKLLRCKAVTIIPAPDAPPSFYINNSVLEELDEGNIGRKKGWVGSEQPITVRPALQGTSFVSRDKLERFVGISHDAACGEEVEYAPAAKASAAGRFQSAAKPATARGE